MDLSLRDAPTTSETDLQEEDGVRGYNHPAFGAIASHRRGLCGICV